MIWCLSTRHYSSNTKIHFIQLIFWRTRQSILQLLTPHIFLVARSISWEPLKWMYWVPSPCRRNRDDLCMMKLNGAGNFLHVICDRRRTSKLWYNVPNIEPFSHDWNCSWKQLPRQQSNISKTFQIEIYIRYWLIDWLNSFIMSLSDTVR